MIDTSKVVPVSGNILVEKRKMMELVDQLRLTIPEEIRAAEEIISQKDHILGNAETTARRTKSQAEDEYRERLNRHELLGQAETKAQQIIREAEERAARTLQLSEAESLSRRTDADAYALRSLRAMENELGTIAASVRKGIEILAGQASANLNSQYFDKEYSSAGASS